MELNTLKKKVQNAYHYLSAFGKIQPEFMIKKIIGKLEIEGTSCLGKGTYENLQWTYLTVR